MAIKKVSHMNSIKKGMAKKMTKEHKKQPKNNNEIAKEDSIETRRKRLDSEIAYFEYNVRKIQYFPEDIEKMKKMSDDERREYMRMLKREDRYTYAEDKPNQ